MTEIEKALLPSGQLAKALAAAQGEMKNAAYNRTNPHFKSKYADLASVRDATIPALSKHGISIAQRFAIRDDRFVLVTEMAHQSGEKIVSEYPLPTGGTEQQRGSAITYARRYSWAALCGIASDEDDDGEAATKATNGNGAKPHGMKAEPPKYKLGDHGGQIPDRANWKGPLTITQLKGAMQVFSRDMEACADLDSLTALLADEALKGVLDQCSRDLPEWWAGNGKDIKGAYKRIEERKKELAALERV